MKNKNINESAYFERMRQLADVDKKIIKESKNSTLLDYKEAGDGRVYGVVKEGGNYFIKTAIKKDTINESDFAYIGGLANITEYKCKSLTEAQKVLNTKVMTINETYGSMSEDENEVEQTPPPAPQPEAPAQPAPEPMSEPAPEVEPVTQPEAPASVDDETINQVKSYVGKAGNLVSGVELPSEKSKQVIKMFLGYFNLDSMSDEDKNELAKMFKQEEQVQETYITEEDDLEDDILDSMPEEPMETPEVDMEEPMEGSMKSGEKKVSIDFNAGTVDVNISEAKIKQLAKKYNVSESYIKWKVRDLMIEGVEKAEKERLKEEKVRKVVRNIIMEKLGLKKKSLNENVSKERLKLEKLVEAVLKKNIK